MLKDYKQFINKLQLLDKETLARTYISNVFIITLYKGINSAKAI
jgi:hypothetical protein